jgi:hypothetical protein
VQEYIQRQLTERSDIEKKFHAMKDDLITRLQNACAQRDDARAQVRGWTVRAFMSDVLTGAGSRLWV